MKVITNINGDVLVRNGQAILTPPNENPVEISTSEEMDVLLVAGNVGKVYLFTGETDDTYDNGEMYIVEEVI